MVNAFLNGEDPDQTLHSVVSDLGQHCLPVIKWGVSSLQLVNKSCRRTASSPAGYILYCNIFIIKPYNIGHTDLDVFVCKSFCHLDIIIEV